MDSRFAKEVFRRPSPTFPLSSSHQTLTSFPLSSSHRTVTNIPQICEVLLTDVVSVLRASILRWRFVMWLQGLRDKFVVTASGGLRGGGDNGDEGLLDKFVVAASGGLHGGGDNGGEGLPGALRAVWGSWRRQQPKTTQLLNFSRVHM
ncbi:hypothetical protein LR48_Vigan10g174400 [Vigna angularis]|uniref:Uncharacterized protein n=1 Tax=Phaseolus angularis TaxID=3914 RepID=A0A0L9VLR6_PHAAN|nr:hypothetical protein LR48_Vigan10g174400 [Vigna angularis]